MAKTNQPPSVEKTTKVTEPVAEKESTDTNPHFYGGSDHVSAKGLSRLQRANLVKLTRTLADSGARLKNGSIVNDRSKVIKYLLEQVS